MGYIYVIADGDATSTKYKLEYVHYTFPQRHQDSDSHLTYQLLLERDGRIFFQLWSWVESMRVHGGEEGKKLPQSCVSHCNRILM